jgi:hypothetical protein
VSAALSVVLVDQGDAVRVALMQTTPASFRRRSEVADALMEEVEKMLQGRHLEH